MRGWALLMCIGNCTRDPELRKMPSGKAVTTVSVAVNGQKDGDVIYYDVDAYDVLAENCCKYLRKGDPAFIEAIPQKRQWTDEKSGGTKTKIAYKARSVVFLPHRGENDEDAGTREAQHEEAGNRGPF